jgi:hypothetical protein
MFGLKYVHMVMLCLSDWVKQCSLYGALVSPIANGRCKIFRVPLGLFMILFFPSCFHESKTTSLWTSTLTLGAFYRDFWRDSFHGNHFKRT